MTRIFDALRKAQAARAPEEAPPRTPAAPAPPVELSGRGAGPTSIGRALRSARRSEGEPASPGATAALTAPPGAAGVVPIHEASALPEDVVREMTKLRVSIEALLIDRACRSVMFVGSQAGEGTSTVAREFAFTLARDARIRTLFVDAHARRPALGSNHAPAGRPSRRPGRSDAPRVAEASAAPAAGRDVDSWPLGGQFHDIGLLSSASVREVVEWGSGRYEWIVFDGPPVLESADSASIAAVADGVVVVVEAGRTKRPVLQRAVDLLHKAGARVMGSVLNRRRLEIPGFIYRRI